MEEGTEEVKQQQTSEEEHVVVTYPHPGVPISLSERCYFQMPTAMMTLRRSQSVQNSHEDMPALYFLCITSN